MKKPSPRAVSAAKYYQLSGSPVVAVIANSKIMIECTSRVLCHHTGPPKAPLSIRALVSQTTKNRMAGIKASIPITFSV